MKVTFTGRHLVVTPALREFAHERLAKLERVLSGLDEAHVILVKEKYRHIAEVVVKGKHLVLTGTQETEDMYSSIGKALEKIEHQAKKHRKKVILSRRRRVNRKTAGSNGNDAAEVVEEIVVATLATGTLMLRDDDYPRKPMTVEEAGLILEEDKRDFLVFRDAGSQRIAVVYRRGDGHFGLILSKILFGEVAFESCEGIGGAHVPHRLRHREPDAQALADVFLIDGDDVVLAACLFLVGNHRIRHTAALGRICSHWLPLLQQAANLRPAIGSTAIILALADFAHVHMPVRHLAVHVVFGQRALELAVDADLSHRSASA